MPEFHKNQVRWEAPEPSKVTLAKPDYSYLTKALDNLAQGADAIADAERVRIDEAMKQDLNEQLNLANQDIENARSVTADFDSLGVKALSRIQATISSYDPAAQRRFLDANPHYVDNTQLAISEKILKRKRDIFENDVENNLPLWTSQAAMIGTEQARQDVIHKIQESLGNISYETTVSNMIFKANQMFDRYNIARLISIGTPEALAEADRLLHHPEKTVTIDPYQRVQFQRDIKSAYKELETARKSLKDPTAQAIVEAYAKLRSYGYNGDADYLYEQVINPHNGKLKTTRGEYALEFDGEPLPMFLEAAGLTQLQRAEIVKAMIAYDKQDPNVLKRMTDTRIRADDLLEKYTIGHDNKNSDQSLAVAGLTEIYDNPILFQYLTDDAQKDVARIVGKNRAAKTEIMTFDSTPFRDVGLTASNATRLVSERTAGYYLKSATGPKWSPVPEYMQTRNATMEDLFQMSLVSPDVNPTGAQRNIYNEVAFGEDAADYLTYSEEKGADSLLDAVLPLRTMFYSDIEDNTIGEYVLLNWEAMVIMKKQGLLEGTRFDSDLSTYTEMFDDMIAALNADGTINQRTTDDAAKEVTKRIRAMAGVNSQLSEYEKRVLAAIEDGAASTQVNRKAGWFGNWLNKALRGSEKVYVPDDALISPEWRDLSVGVEASSKTKTRRKAAKEADKYMKKGM